MEKPSSNAYLEPRVAKLETGLEMLTRDVASLAQIVRDQGNNIEEQIKQLAVGVSQAAAPRRTDWQSLIALLMLIMAVGTAAIIPINQTAQDNKDAVQALVQQMHEHNQLQLHPVGQALLGRVEFQLQEHVKSNTRENDEQNRVWEKQTELLTERICARLNKVETSESERNKADLDELRVLRRQAIQYHMGPCPKELGK